MTIVRVSTVTYKANQSIVKQLWRQISITFQLQIQWVNS